MWACEGCKLGQTLMREPCMRPCAVGNVMQRRVKGQTHAEWAFWPHRVSFLLISRLQCGREVSQVSTCVRNQITTKTAWITMAEKPKCLRQSVQLSHSWQERHRRDLLTLGPTQTIHFTVPESQHDVSMRCLLSLRHELACTLGPTDSAPCATAQKSDWRHRVATRCTRIGLFPH